MKIILKNGNLTAEIDGTTGGILSLDNAQTGETCAFSYHGFSLTADGKTYFDAASADGYSKTDNGFSFEFTDAPFRAVLEYLRVPDADFIERRLTFSRDGEWTCERVTCDAVILASPAREILLHDDQTLWHVPTNFFLRFDKGGVCAGLEYPYWDGISNADVMTSRDGVTLAYSPSFTVKDGSPFVSEKTFFGVYENTNKYRKSHGPYPDGKERKYYKSYSYGGLSQHFSENKLPDNAGMPEETLDLGEVWAMQDFMRPYLPKEGLPEGGYYVWQNGWWAGITKPDIEAVKPLARAGVRDLMTFAIYFGHDSHPSTSPRYIRDARTSPLGFPVMGHGFPTAETEADGWHHEATAGDDSGDIIGYTEEFRAPDEYEKFISEAKELGVYVSSFSTPNNAYTNHPEWLAKGENGETYKYFGTPLSCPACDEYMDFHFDMLCRVLDRFDCRFWAFDGRWLNFREIAGYSFGSIGEEPCFSDSHGHPAGDSRYKEWKNIENFKKKLRERYPDMCLEQYYGLKRGGVWSLKSLNADENYYEMGCVENNRDQTWHNEYDRFRPTYMNYTSISGKTPSEFEYSMISSLSTSAYCQLAGGYAALRDYPETADIFKKMKAWADANYKYLLRRRCLFGPPGEGTVDGSAHVIGHDGYIFLFSVPECCGECEIVLDSLIGLDADPKASYTVSTAAAVTYEGTTASCECEKTKLRYGDVLRVKLSPHTAAILEIRGNTAERITKINSIEL